jgi:hypothetical protein
MLPTMSLDDRKDRKDRKDRRVWFHMTFFALLASLAFIVR